MIKTPMDVLKQHPIRKTKTQKSAFREAVCTYARSLGYECTTEKGSFGARNVVIGNPDTAKYLVTAHYDTCAGMLLPNLITPCNFWTFLGYQLVVTAALLVPAILLGILVGFVTYSVLIGEIVYFALFFGALILMMFGPANKHNANDNTSGVVTLLEIAKNIPQSAREKVCFVLFDLEEAGLLGSGSYRKKHRKASQNQLVLNLDCVGDGDTIMLFPGKKVRKNEKMLQSLTSLEGTFGGKTVAVRRKGFSVYPSDQGKFPYGVGIAALHKTKGGLLYMSRIHTKRDTVLESKNVKILRDALTGLLAE